MICPNCGIEQGHNIECPEAKEFYSDRNELLSFLNEMTEKDLVDYEIWKREQGI